MITEQLQNKINKSYDVLKVAAKMSKTYYHKPLIITYSGGKDSDVILKLAMECLDEEDFEVINSHTTVDAPETVYYIRDKFKHLNEIGIKATVQMAHYEDGTPKTMWNLIVDKQIPPTRFARYCCRELKETSTPNRFIATGVRRGRNVFGVKTPKKKDAAFYSLERVKENLADSLKRGGQQVSALDCKFIEDAKNNKELVCSPIYEWSDMDVWDFIRGRNMEYNPLYDMGYSRVGCIGCPLSNEQVKELEMYPKYKENYIKAFDRMLAKRRAAGKDDVTGKTGLHRWTDGEAVYRWWINDQTVPGQISIEDYLGKGADDEV